MKKLILGLIIVTLTLLASSCSEFSNRGEINRPFIESASNNALSFEKVELTDSSTILHAVVHFRPKWWVRLAGTSEIVADGKSYPMTSVDGIVVDEQVYMPDSGVIRFTMTFPAIPASVKNIDFSEGDYSGWCIWGIDITGKAGHNDNMAGIPSKLRAIGDGQTLVEPVMDFSDSTIVNIHLLGYRPSMGNKLKYALNTLHGQVGVDEPVAVDSLGNACLRLAISSPARLILIWLDDSSLEADFFLCPGETVNLYADTHVSGIHNMNVRDNTKFPEDYRKSYSDGRYRDVSMHRGRGNYYGLQHNSGEFGDYRMTGDQYTDYIIRQYKAQRDSIEASDLSPVGRQYWMAILNADLIAVASDAKRILTHNYYHIHDNWGDKVHPDSVPVELSTENVKAIASLLDFNDMDMLFSDELAYEHNSDFWRNAGVDPGILETVSLYGKAYGAANNAALTEELIAPLRSANAALADEVEAHNKAVKARLEALDYEMITPTPDVAADKLFDAIVSPHRGKVVMVDLWNTWCAPCRAALAKNEPEKSRTLSSDDIVWIYIADESSPMLKYLSMIKDIQGLHYRVTTEQMSTLRNQFEFDGIPYYILVDRKGHSVGRPDLRDHYLFKKTILSELAK